MIVHFIGAGPGDPDLLTLRGRDLIARCPVCLYAGSLVPPAVVAHAPPDARVVDTASLTLDETMAEILTARDAGQDVARVHSGDPSLYGATHEQMRRLDALGIAYAITPGVPAYAAAAAALGKELTLPGIGQTVVLTRMPGKSTPMPAGETLKAYAQTGATLAIHLAARRADDIIRILTPHYGAEVPAIIAYRVGWPDQALIPGPLASLATRMRSAKITRTALVLVGPVLGEAAGAAAAESALYSADHAHILRPKVT